MDLHRKEHLPHVRFFPKILGTVALFHLAEKCHMAKMSVMRVVGRNHCTIYWTPRVIHLFLINLK